MQFEREKDIKNNLSIGIEARIEFLIKDFLEERIPPMSVKEILETKEFLTHKFLEYFNETDIQINFRRPTRIEHDLYEWEIQVIILSENSTIQETFVWATWLGILKVSYAIARNSK